MPLMLNGVDVKSAYLNGVSLKQFNLNGIAVWSSAAPWDIGGATYLRSSISLRTHTPTPTEVTFSADGTKMYVTGLSSSGTFVVQYGLSTAWNISTAAYSKKIEVTGATTGICFSPDGTKMILTSALADRVERYTLLTPWDIATAERDFFQSYAKDTGDNVPTDIYFSPDGTKMYIVGSGNNAVRQYTLSTAWDINTASFLQSFSVALQSTNSSGVEFSPDGKNMYVTGSDIHQYTLSTAWNINTAVFLRSYILSITYRTPRSIRFKPDGKTMYIITSKEDYHVFSLSTAWNISTATFFYTSSTFDDEPSGFAFNSTGTILYEVDYESDLVESVNLSTAWDLRSRVTGSKKEFYIGEYDINPQGVFFSPDGTKMYIVGSENDLVYQFTLSTAWDVSTALFAGVPGFLSSSDPEPSSVTLSSDGTKMYLLGRRFGVLLQYNLSSPWWPGSATPVNFIYVSANDALPQSVYFSPDGTKMYIVGSENDLVYQYALSTAWDITTASFLQSFSVALKEGSPTGIYFKPDGTMMYIVGSDNDLVHQYALG
jgi:DNA-binding beta-propeller fold protein YncE